MHPIDRSDETHMRLALRAALHAGEAVMRHYKPGMSVTYKDDNSPLTAADRASHETICACLSASGMPILSEENRAADGPARHSWNDLWLVDPLDGTKEFVKRNGDFTINIARIVGHRPTLGIVYVPAHHDCFVAESGIGAWRIKGQDAINRMRDCPDHLSLKSLLPPLCRDERGTTPLRVVASASHLTPETEAFISRLRTQGHVVETVARGSALKLCMIATGEAHLYPRLAPTMEWDTAAAQVVVEAAGGQVVDFSRRLHERFLKDGLRTFAKAPSLTYNNRASLKNPWFVAVGAELTMRNKQ